MNKKLTFCLLLCLVTFALAQRTEQALKDQVKQLDGYYNFTSDFQMYSGYLTLQESPQISIHYVFITSMRNSPKDDVTLWLNGGPGCSSMLGFTQQVGPNNLLPGSKFFSQLKNPYSWNKVSNLLFFESPAGVGFSINDDKQYEFNDTRTAQDARHALQLWYQRFPQFKPNNFWISGQSYCGMYIPFMAHQILQTDPSINLKGILIGNGAMLLDWNWRRMIGDKFWMSHYYYGPEISKLINQCKYTDQDDHIPSCARGMAMADRATDLVNPYMTTSVCYTPKQFFKPRSSQSRRFSRVPFHTIKNPKLKNIQSGSDSPCTDDQGIQAFFNIENVKKQLHIKNNVTWQSCSERVGQNYHMNLTSLTLFDGFKQKGLKILLYSGNVDAVVPYVETQEYIKKIGWAQKSERKPLVNARGSLMGWNVQYDGLTYVVINGAGHMVPGDKPHAAYEMFKNFIGADKDEQQIASQ